MQEQIDNSIEPQTDNTQLSEKEEFKELAMQAFGAEMVDKYPELLANASNYDEYQKGLLSKVHAEKMLLAEKDIRNKALLEAEELRIEKLSHIPDIQQEIENRLVLRFNTSAPTPLELCDYVTKNTRNLNLNPYRGSVMLYVLDKIANQPMAIKPAIDSIHRRWESSVAATTYVQNYLHDTYKDSSMWEQKELELVELLPESLRNESSPLKYKQYRAVEMLLQQSRNEDEDLLYDRLFSNKDNNLNYCASYQEALEASEPVRMAEYKATEDTKRRESTATPLETSFRVIGEGIGTVVGLKYKLADNFNSAIDEGLGEYAETYRQNKEEVEKRKRELHNLRMREAEIEAHVLEANNLNAARTQASAGELRVDAYGRYVDQLGRPVPVDAFGRPIRQQVEVEDSSDFSPEIPKSLIVCGIAAFLALVVSAFFKDASIFAYIGLGLAFGSGLGLEHKGKSILPRSLFVAHPLITVVAGYIIFFISFSL